jgi:hypothetical protein
VLPEGRHQCTLPEVAESFALNAHRQDLWLRFQAFLTWVASQPAPAEILIDGSFTSDKALPSDVDVVFDLTDCLAAHRDHWLGVFATQRDWLKQEFRVDFWVYCPGANRDLRAFFEYVRPEEGIIRGMAPEQRKGVLRVAL